jgi:hypothetical protein
LDWSHVEHWKLENWIRHWGVWEDKW